MRKKSFLSAGVLFLGAIIALGAIGVANGLWSHNLNIDGYVETGDLNAHWSAVVTNDPPGTLDPKCSWPGFPCANHPLKDVARCLAEGDLPSDVIRIELENAYPSYVCTITATLENNGSIPFNIIDVILMTGNGNDQGVEGNCAGFQGVNQVNLAGYQVDPSANVGAGHTSVNVVCKIHVKESALQSNCTYAQCLAEPDQVDENIYHFAVKACVAQWNETATFQQCTGEDPSIGTQHEGPDVPFVFPPELPGHE